MIDGWYSGYTHYVSIFVSFPHKNSIGYLELLLVLSLMGNEKSQNSYSFFNIISYVFSYVVMEVNQKSLSNIAGILGENCSTNRASSC